MTHPVCLLKSSSFSNPLRARNVHAAFRAAGPSVTDERNHGMIEAETGTRTECRYTPMLSDLILLLLFSRRNEDRPQ